MKASISLKTTSPAPFIMTNLTFHHRASSIFLYYAITDGTFMILHAIDSTDQIILILTRTLVPLFLANKAGSLATFRTSISILKNSIAIFVATVILILILHYFLISGKLLIFRINIFVKNFLNNLFTRVLTLTTILRAS